VDFLAGIAGTLAAQDVDINTPADRGRMEQPTSSRRRLGHVLACGNTH
jgi:hypothetical protein